MDMQQVKITFTWPWRPPPPHPGGREVPQLIEDFETYQPEVKREYTPCLPLFVMLARLAKMSLICL